ncbi:MAG: prolyl oligopeptidase family protein [Phenylobacterium sp.]|nr:prolyl oligopeptidase family protein [Phenylobacterium sp.]
MAAAMLVASGLSAAAAPLEAYGKLPNIEQATVSPSGAFVALAVTDGDKRAIAIEEAGQGELEFSLPVGAVKLRDLTWAGDHHLIVTTSSTVQPFEVSGPRVENFLAFDLDLDKRRIRPLMQDFRRVGDVLNTIYGSPEVRTVGGKPTVFVVGMHFVDNQGQFGLFRVDLDSDVATLIDKGLPGVYHWLLSPEGLPIAESLYNDYSGVWTLRLKNGAGPWRAVQTITAPIDPPSILGLSRDGKSVLVDVDDDKVGRGWREVSLGSGAWGETMPMLGAQADIHDAATGRLIGVHALEGDKQVYTFFDAHDAAVWRGVAKAFDGDIVTLQSWSDDRKRIVVRVDSARLGPAYALVDLIKGDAKWLGAEYAGVKAEDISPVQPVRYKAADGLEITGYLTLPRGRDPHGLPLVVLAHGGPAARDTPGFDWWAQALAAQGYAVLQANFRGSAGLGGDFYAAGFGQFGRKMQTDLSDGVRYLAQTGAIDPKRVCIVGASYGGYAALAGATLETGVYRCAVSYAGPSDMATQITDSRQKGGRDSQLYWERYIGAKNLDDPLMAKISPASHAAEAAIPVLLIHGKDDTVVPIQQSQRMAAALKRAGKPVEFVVLPGEDHRLSRGETRLAMLKAAVAFLEKNNPLN